MLNVDIGKNYEVYVMNQLLAENDSVYLWKDVPEKILIDAGITRKQLPNVVPKCDIGIDIVAVKNNIPQFVQCKNYSSKSICIDDIAGFSFFRSIHKKLLCKLYYNGILSNRISEYHPNDGTLINMKYDNIVVNDNIDILTNIIPRKYQMDAVNELKNKHRSILNLPCGMGKTYTSLMLASHRDNTIIFAPTKELVVQIANYYREILRSHNNIIISQDGTRNTDNIVLKEKNIIVSTYKSCDVVNKIINKIKNPFVIIDEFHNLSENDVNVAKNEMFKILNSKLDILFLSATPKYLSNQKIFGSVIYKYSWDDAIKNKYINDFNVIIPTDDFYTIKMNKILEIFKIYDNIDEKIIQKVYYGLRNMIYNGDKKILWYLVTTTMARKCENIIDWMSKLFGICVNCNIIDYTTTKNKRAEILKSFKSGANMEILLSVHVLDEGIDILECDSVYITKLSNNMLNTVQRMSRCCRYKKMKPKSNIYLWCGKKKVDMIIKYINDNTNDEIKSNIIRLSPDCYIDKKNEYFDTNSDDSKNVFDNYYNDVNVPLIEKYVKIFANVKVIYNNNELYFCANDLFTLLGEDSRKNKELFYAKKSKCLLMYNDVEYINEAGMYLLLVSTNSILSKNLRHKVDTISNGRFIISLDTFSNIADTAKSTIKETLINSYTKEKDYITVKSNCKKVKGRPLEEIRLTINTVKNMCLRTNGKKGNEFRSHFL